MADEAEQDYVKRRKTADEYEAPLSPMSLAIAASIQLVEEDAAEAAEDYQEKLGELVENSGDHPLVDDEKVETPAENQTVYEDVVENDVMAVDGFAPPDQPQIPLWDVGYEFESQEPRLLFEAASPTCARSDITQSLSRNNFFKGTHRISCPRSGIERRQCLVSQSPRCRCMRPQLPRRHEFSSEPGMFCTFL
jgi:hypothetical protein